MINANELRLNNLLQYGHEIAPVNAIWSNGNFELHSDVIQFWLIEKGDEMCTGIPLSEEWLLRFGFDKSYDNWGGYIAPKINGYSMRIRINTIGICYFSMNMVGKPIYIDYVHQLQNLYYALTGTELELKK